MLDIADQRFFRCSRLLTTAEGAATDCMAEVEDGALFLKVSKNTYGNNCLRITSSDGGRL